MSLRYPKIGLQSEGKKKEKKITVDYTRLMYNGDIGIEQFNVLTESLEAVQLAAVKEYRSKTTSIRLRDGAAVAILNLLEQLHFIIRFAFHEFYNILYSVFYIIGMPVGTFGLLSIHNIQHENRSITV